MNNTKDHQAFCHAILHRVGSLPDVRLFPRRVGLAIPIGTDRPIMFGIAGEADLQGFFRHGQGLHIEVKTGLGRMSISQQLWRDMVKKFNIVHIEARLMPEESIDQAADRILKLVKKHIA